MSQNPPANRWVVVIAVVLSLFFLWTALVRPLIDGASPGATVTVFSAGVLLAGTIVGIVCARLVRMQRAQRRALAEREPQACVFGSTALNGVAALLARAIPLLELGPAPRGLQTSSPTGVVDADGFRLVRGGARLTEIYRVPRDRIAGVARGGIQEGAFRHPTLMIVVAHGGEFAKIPVPVSREGAPLRRATPEEVDRLLADAARIWGVAVLGDVR